MVGEPVREDTSHTTWQTHGGSFLPGRWRLAPLVGTLVLALIGWYVYATIENTGKQRIAEILRTILNANVEALREWIRERTETLVTIASEPDVTAWAADLAHLAEDIEKNREAIEDPSLQAKIQQTIGRRVMANGFERFLLLSTDGEMLIRVGSIAIGHEIAEKHAAFVTRVAAGETVLNPPYGAEPLVAGESERVVISVGTPIRGPEGQVVLLLCAGEEADGAFTRILQVGQFGQTGETYAVDHEGWMISVSRFEEDLRRIGLIGENANRLRAFHIRDPGVNLVAGERSDKAREELPLTRMAASLTSGESGLDADGYRDYRGVPVVGAWLWLPEYAFGVATEVDKDEAYALFYQLRAAFIGLFVLLVLVSLGVLFTGRRFFVMRSHARSAMKQVQQLGQYTLEEKLGEGGMGEVYRARHALLRRPTALKLLTPNKANEEMVRRFEREVQLTATLTHPNTIAVYDFGRTPDNLFYYVMEFLDGFDASKIVRIAGALPEGRVIHLLRQACGSLHEAHELGLIHRDIKPANIMVCKRGGMFDFVKVLDFGLVKNVAATSDTEVTSAGIVAGTPQYLSPEALRSESPPDRRSDIYALGAVAYYLLTGTPVFQCSSVMETVASHLNTPPEPPSKRRGRSIDAKLERLVLDCLAKKQEERPQTAEEVARRLAECAAAGAWSEELACAWWTEHAHHDAAAGESRVGHTLLIDVAKR